MKNVEETKHVAAVFLRPECFKNVRPQVDVTGTCMTAGYQYLVPDKPTDHCTVHRYLLPSCTLCTLKHPPSHCCCYTDRT